MRLHMALAEPQARSEHAEAGLGRSTSVERTRATDWAKVLWDSLAEARGIVHETGTPYPFPEYGGGSFAPKRTSSTTHGCPRRSLVASVLVRGDAAVAGAWGPHPTGYGGHVTGGDADDGRREMKALLGRKLCRCLASLPSLSYPSGRLRSLAAWWLHRWLCRWARPRPRG